jgi:hypothetical protein
VQNGTIPTIGPDLQENSVNFIFEEFTKILEIDLSKLRKSCNSSLILIMTEFIGDNFLSKSFNAFEKNSFVKTDRDKYLKKRYTSFLKVLKSVKFDKILVLHPDIKNNLSILMKKTLNFNTEINEFFPLLYPIHLKTFISLNDSKSLNLGTNFEKDYRYYNSDINLFDGSELEHYFRYGQFESRRISKNETTLNFLQKLNNLKELTSNMKLKLNFMGSNTSYRARWISLLENDFLKFNFSKIEFLKGWDLTSYNLAEILDETTNSIPNHLYLDCAISQSENWPYMSPIRIWRAFACGTIPVRIGGIRDEAHPLNFIVEQVNSTYPVTSLSLAINDVNYIKIFYEKVVNYNRFVLARKLF